jgi:hypothetical protein
MDSTPNGLNPGRTQPPVDSIQNDVNPERLKTKWTRPRIDSTSKGLNLEWTHTRLDSTQKRDSHSKGTDTQKGLNLKMDSTSKWT